MSDTPVVGKLPVRIKKTKILKDLACAYTWPALQTAVAIMKNEDEPGQTRLHAVEIVLSYGHGKPRQQIEHTGKDGGAIEVVDGRAAADAIWQTAFGEPAEDGQKWRN